MADQSIYLHAFPDPYQPVLAYDKDLTTVVGVQVLFIGSLS